MTIRRGEPWGVPCELAADVTVVDGDAALSGVLTAARLGGAEPPLLAVRHGDVARTMGGATTDRVVPGAVLVRAPIDAIRVTADGRAPAWCCAHVVARQRWWRGRVVIVANAQFVDGRDVAPRAHPNDGRVDLLDVAPTMSWRDRVRAWRRTATGTHVPHPDIETRQVTSLVLEFDAPVGVWLDGRRWQRAQRLEVEVEADAVTVLA
ncbi:MAG: diacylglycerol/lipid kinase family protein [Ilumatobacteraceae bacterium]